MALLSGNRFDCVDLVSFAIVAASWRRWRVTALCFRTILGTRASACECVLRLAEGWAKRETHVSCSEHLRQTLRNVQNVRQSVGEPTGAEVSEWTHATLASQNSIHIQLNATLYDSMPLHSSKVFVCRTFMCTERRCLGTETQCMWDELVLDTSSLVFPVLDGIQVSSVGVCSSTDFSNFQRI